jgi:hypothetical protein
MQMATWSAEKKEEYRKNHPFKMPVQQPRHNYAHGDVKTYFDAIFNTGHAEYKGMVSIAARKVDDEMRVIAVVPATQMGDWAAQMHVSTHMDYYYYGKAQQSSSNATWGPEHAFAYNAINVDIDAHSVMPDSHSIENLVGLLQTMLPDYSVKLPNYVIYSGRGIHMVWLIDQVSSALAWMF